MKRIAILLIAVVMAGCGGQKLLKPSNSSNAGTTALVAYSVAGAYAGKYFALPLCATPAVYPCKTQAINDRLFLADTAAYNAAKAADAAGNSPAAQAKADEAKAALEKANAKPEVSGQVELVNAKTGGAP